MGTDTLSGIENVQASYFADTVTGDAAANKLEGLAGNDTLNGGEGNDTVDGGTGDDVLQGNVGDDSLLGSLGNDFIRGGAGNDTLDGGDGNDTLHGNAGNDVLMGGSGLDTVQYFSDTTLVGVTVNLGTLTGQLISTEMGTDTLSGIENVQASYFADTVTGDAAANKLEGLAGNDTLNGGEGNDILAGGLGNDTFVFNTVLNGVTNVDTIVDFASGDKIGLAASIFTAFGSGPVALGQFLSYDATTGALAYDVDGYGAGSAVVVALMGTTTHPTLSDADFIKV